jgi:hypothetical protein
VPPVDTNALALPTPWFQQQLCEPIALALPTPLHVISLATGSGILSRLRGSEDLTEKSLKLIIWALCVQHTQCTLYSYLDYLFIALVQNFSRASAAPDW